MGGRGAGIKIGAKGIATGASAAKITAIISEEMTLVETEYRRGKNHTGRPYFLRNVVELTEDQEGVIKVSRPQWEYENSNANTIGVKANLKAYALSKSDTFSISEVHNVNFNNVKVIKGDTYSMRNVAKSLGFKFDSKTKQWIK